MYRHPRSGELEADINHVSVGERDEDAAADNKHTVAPKPTMRAPKGVGVRDGGKIEGMMGNVRTKTEVARGSAGGGFIRGGRPAVAREPFVFSPDTHPERFDVGGQEDDVLPEIGGGRAKKGGWGGAWEDYVAG